ncbi:hypothetical protein [Georgenia thermotolerans]|uniref:Uncharacterized protein n=1 Tax=Georgenia thermotolerans TaxID=527326 RepID=A0A7J5UMA5_9MICO|nr:hypothetical protein [Georgenia thermotolerans]KAE8763244.1 hypothetical protein GB883_15130 [Georgenia thermotolerans]
MRSPARRQLGPLRTVAVLAVLAVLAVGAGAAGYAVGRTSDAPTSAAVAGTAAKGATPTTGGTQAPEPGSVEAIAAELAADQAAERAELAADLSAAGKEAYDRLMPVLAEVSEVLPVGGGTGHAADPAAADRWLQEVGAARATLVAVPEGTSEHTVTRAAFLGAVDLLDAALRDLMTASSATADGPGTPAGRRDAAVELWLAGAAQLDSLMIGSSGDHVHLFLTPDGDPRSVPREFADHQEGSAG